MHQVMLFAGGLTTHTHTLSVKMTLPALLYPSSSRAQSMRDGSLHVHNPYFLLGQVCHKRMVPSSLPLAASSPSGL